MRQVSCANESELLPACLSHLRFLPSKLSHRGCSLVKGHADDGGAGGPGRWSGKVWRRRGGLRLSRPGAGAEAASGLAMARERWMAGLVVVAVNRMPAAEVEVSADLVRRLLADQHPDLARLPVEFLANGWDNELYRVGDGLLARLPRR